MRRSGARDLINALADDGLRHNELRLAVFRGLRVLVGLRHGVHVVAVNGENLEAARSIFPPSRRNIVQAPSAVF